LPGLKGTVSQRSSNGILTYNETSLHVAIKDWYAQPGDFIESEVDGFRIDILRGDLLIEIQIGNFARLRNKLNSLLKNHRVRLVHPISCLKWINHVDTQKRRLSPRKGKLDHIFQELVYITPLLNNSNLSLDILFIHEEEIRLNDGRGSWRRKGTSIIDRKLLAVVDHFALDFPDDFRSLLEVYPGQEFTSRDVAGQRNIPASLARKMIYCMVKTGAVAQVGRRGRHNLYAFRRINGEHE